MDRERLKRVEELFQQALDLPEADRGPFLDRECGDDVELRREVEAYLSAHDDAGTFMEHAIVDAVPEAPAIPERVGHYRLLRKIGEGGMSEVYLAHRDDDEYRQQVAIKVIRRDIGRDDLLRRFRTERQILAGLDHPNIAKLLDGGTTDNGIPYFVMDYIDGEPIDRYCDRLRLPVSERLALFRTVCSAVQYAHQNLVVHRDIKASNILVTAEGVPKLLDFGIAKLLDPAQFPQPVEKTATWLRPMTPTYASPEQIRGETVGTPTDVYSLGVLLFKLLTGHLPYPIHGLSAGEVTRVILEQEPERPSTAIGRTDSTDPASVTPDAISRLRNVPQPQLRRLLSGDLDNIVLMALRKEPQRRYASVEQLSEDLRRYLVGLPVIARPDTVGYRAAKFLRRNRLGVGVAAVFVLLLAGFGITMAIQRDEARRERDRAEQVVAFMKSIFLISDPYGPTGESITAREILDRGTERMEEELADQPEVQATLAEAIGSVYRTLGLFDRAEPQLRRSLELRQQLFGEPNLDVAYSMDALGYLLFEKGDYPAAEPLLRGALEIRRELLGRNDMLIAASTGHVGILLKHMGDLEGAEAMYRESLAIHETLDEPVELASLQNSVASLLIAKNDMEGALAMFRESLELRREALGPTHPQVGTTLSNIGVVLGMQGKVEESEKALRDALGVRRAALGDEHPAVADSMNNLAKLLYLNGDAEAAEPLYREALAIKSGRLGGQHPQVATMSDNLSELLQQQGDYAEAESLARQALAARRETLGDRHVDIGKSLIRLGSVLVDSGRAADAEPLMREGVRVLEEAAPPGHWLVPQAQSQLARCLTSLGRFEEAEPLALAGYEGLSRVRGAGHRATRAARERLIDLYEAWNRPESAARYREDS